MFKFKLNKMAVICISLRQEGDVYPVYVKSNLELIASVHIMQILDIKNVLQLLFFYIEYIHGFDLYTLQGDNSLKSVESFDHMIFVCRFQASR